MVQDVLLNGIVYGDIVVASVYSCIILVGFIFHNEGWSPLSIHTEGTWPASLDSDELDGLLTSANGSSGNKSQNFCLQQGQGVSPPIIFLAK